MASRILQQLRDVWESHLQIRNDPVRISSYTEYVIQIHFIGAEHANRERWTERFRFPGWELDHASPAAEGTPERQHGMGGVRWDRRGQKNPERTRSYRRGRHEPGDRSHPRLHTAPFRRELERMEHLLGGRHKWDLGRSHGWQIQERGWRILFPGNLGRQTHLLSLHLVEDHREFCAMGTGVLDRWRQDLGDELGQHVRASGWSLRCKQKTTDGMTLIF